MFYKLPSFAAIGIASQLLSQTSQAQSKRTHVEKVEERLSVIDEKTMHTLPGYWQAILRWPSFDQIEKGQVLKHNGMCSEDVNPLLVNQAIDSTFEWLNIILKSKWVPDRASVQILALRREVNGEDAIRLRYRIEGCIIQVACLYPTIWIAIQRPVDPNKYRTITLDAIKAISVEIMEQFTTLKFPKIMQIAKSLAPNGNGFNTTQHYEPGRDWEGMLDWWTDGTTIMIYTNKTKNPRAIPGALPEWFTEEKTRKLRGGLPIRDSRK